MTHDQRAAEGIQALCKMPVNKLPFSMILV